ncbi:CDP-alcohol phosphatidyltransferase [Rodentibacter caecimuris]|uniref:CDP-alcohol phosphatidyltransferase n=1 Tax=Rodentibacter caecimuris TaxID=1796644 RepID=A0A9X8VXG2_9PAST|nr:MULTISPECIES: CDP-alcohol phosphatidyltransferase family protein [Pasteurellaceae]AOF53558.1 CDP-diacylglycerol--glycerol-3-phosphate 3-phosphatidyltransferase [Pasteurellaceae bacterium NI1060]MCQ9124229.1 CDP-alcohol phosphatidyltransferase family protein [Rodentibacter heylii]MCR1837702.1 CDP-alcohol phosphatidyltransferase family protein [Pasteurella caecimuris]MCU0106614.1 CDP-alcohol phosphatidyltransferase family protein [Pasteurella caecimuris]OOF72549.1 CDP-alcohol phosphatidyltran
MSIYQLKPAFQNLLHPLVKRLEQWGITANQVTLFACGLSLFFGMVLTLFSAISGLFYLLPIWLFLRMALNAIDGMLAREFNQKSDLGGYLNEITDVVADTTLYLPFAFITPFSAESVMGFIFLAMMTEFCGVLGQVHGNNGRRYDGPLGKSDRAFLIGALGLAYAYFGELPLYLSSLFWLANLALILTAYNRVKRGLATTS